MKKALVIGAGGFVGRYLIEHLHNDCGCIKCFFENNRGENNPSWKGGENEITAFFDWE